MSLDYKYFTTIHAETHNNVSYRVVKPVGHPMILFSETEGYEGTPLACVQLKCNTARALIAKRPFASPVKCDFQGMIDKDGQEFELVISNLTNDGLIKIDFMKEDVLIRDVDPGAARGGLNQVNELHAYQSYAIPCDQKDNRTLILNAIKDEVTGANLTVKQAETAGTPKPTGTYYYVTVVPQLGKSELVKKFAKTRWACVDVFCIKEIAEVPRGPLVPMCSSNWTMSSRGSDVMRGGFESIGMPRSAGSAYPESAYTRSSSALLSCQGDSFRREYDQMDTDNADNAIQNSSAASVGSGRQVTVNFGFTGIGYSYDTHGEHCCLGLSVATNLQFKPSPNKEELIESGRALIQSLVDGTNKGLLDKLDKVYTSTECVICLDSEERLDTVFYQCGHQCTHAECSKTLSKCPLCRTSITAALKV